MYLHLFEFLPKYLSFAQKEDKLFLPKEKK